MISMLKRRAPIDPFNANLFQVKGNNAIRRLGISVSADLSKLTPFPSSELAELKKLEPELQGIDVHKLPLLYTTQLPISRGTLIDTASSMMFLSVPPVSKNGNGGSANTVVVLQKIMADYKSLSKEKINSEFLDLMLEKTAGDIQNIRIDANGDFLKEAAIKRRQNFEKLISDINAVLQKMHEKGLEGTSIYKKLTVDLDYLEDMHGFIRNSIKKVQSVRLNLNKMYISLERRQKNLEDALDKTETKDTLDKFITLAKYVFGSAFIGAATFLAAKGEALKILETLSNSPNIWLIGISTGILTLVVIISLSMEILKAFQKNNFIKIFYGMKEKVIKKAVNYTHRNLKVIGYKATKEAAFAGYLEALQSEASKKYLAAAFQGEFDTINKIYDRQVDRMLGEHTLGYYFRRFADMFRRNTERKMDSTLGKAAAEVDGSFVDIGLRVDGKSTEPE